MSARRAWSSLASLALLASLAGCAAVLGIDHDYGDLPEDAAAGASGVAGTGGAGSGGGASGTSATAGASGTNGTSGTGATAGTSGTDGTSGTSATAGASGTSGTSGTGAAAGTSGTSAAAGASGTTGTSGTSSAGSAGSAGAGGSAGSGAVVLESVQTGSTDIPAGSASRTVAINGVDPAHAFLVFGTAFDSTSSSQSEISGQITSTNQLTFRRYASSGTATIPIRYYVAHFTSGVRVQRGSQVLSVANQKVALPSPVDLAHSVPLVTFRNVGSLYGLDDYVRAELTGASELSLSMYQAFGNGTAEWQVVSFDNARVQSGNVAVAGSDTVVAATPSPSLALGATWLLLSYQVANVSNSAAEVMIRGTLDTADRIVFERSGTGASAQLTYYAVTFDDGTSVQSAARAITDASTPTSLTPAVDPAKSIAVAGGIYQRGGATSYATAANPGYATFNLDLGSGSQLTATRGASSASATLSWYVLAFR